MNMKGKCHSKKEVEKTAELNQYIGKSITSWILRLTSMYFIPPSSVRLKRLKTFSAGQNNKSKKPSRVNSLYI
jgi:hypothetical protein